MSWEDKKLTTDNLPERSKGGDLRSPDESRVGSNPTVVIMDIYNSNLHVVMSGNFDKAILIRLI
jgi:hypothetical protein